MANVDKLQKFSLWYHMYTGTLIWIYKKISELFLKRKFFLIIIWLILVLMIAINMLCNEVITSLCVVLATNHCIPFSFYNCICYTYTKILRCWFVKFKFARILGYPNLYVNCLLVHFDLVHLVKICKPCLEKIHKNQTQCTTWSILLKIWYKFPE